MMRLGREKKKGRELRTNAPTVSKHLVTLGIIGSQGRHTTFQIDLI